MTHPMLPDNKEESLSDVVELSFSAEKIQTQSSEGVKSSNGVPELPLTHFLFVYLILEVQKQQNT